MLESDSGHSPVALDIYRELLSRDPSSAHRWSDLGGALRLAGQRPEAEYCFQRALSLGPRIAQILLDVADFYYQTEQWTKVLPYGQRILHLVPDNSFNAILFTYYRNTGLPQTEILTHGIPPLERPVRAYFRYLLQSGLTPQAAEAWTWISARSFADHRLIVDYTNYLLSTAHLSEASRIWSAHASQLEPGYRQSNMVFNGEFETEFTGSRFDWTVVAHDGVTANRAAASPSGPWALRVQFDGEHNADFHHVSQSVDLKPGQYRFEARLKTENVTTDKGVSLLLTDPERGGTLNVETEAVIGTTPWTKIEKRFTWTGPHRILEVRIVRHPSLKFDSKIKGTVWLDSVKIVAEPN
jgi:hypothetical protein